MAAEAGGGWLHCVPSQEAERDKANIQLIYSFLFGQAPSHGLVPTTFRLGVLSSINPPWKCL